MRTGKLRPGLLIRGASSQRPIRSPSRVADITSRRRSGRRVACTSKASAAPRSPARCRSWNSSKITAPTPDSSGSPWINRVRMPSVTTSMRVAALTRDSKRMRYPTVCPTSSPSWRDMNSAAARAAIRRGSSIRMRRPSSQPASSRANGTWVVLPAPGGASSTSRGCPDKASRIRGSRGEIGKALMRAHVTRERGDIALRTYRRRYRAFDGLRTQRRQRLELALVFVGDLLGVGAIGDDLWSDQHK